MGAFKEWFEIEEIVNNDLLEFLQVKNTVDYY